MFKIHPMERGHTRDRNFIRQVSALNNVKDRVHVLDGGSLSLLTRHSAGMHDHDQFDLGAVGNPSWRAFGGDGSGGLPQPELAFCVQRGGDLDRFWSEGFVASPDVRQRYLSWIVHECLSSGDFYAKDGVEAAITSLRVKLESALVARNQSKVLAGNFGAAREG